MSQILIIGSKTVPPPSLQRVLESPDFRPVVRDSPEAAKTALERDAFGIALIYSDSGEHRLSQNIRAILEIAPDLQIIVVAPEYSEEEAEIAYELGASFYFAEPLQPKSFRRLLLQSLRDEESPNTPRPASRDLEPRVHESPNSALQVLRDFSNVLGFSLDYKAFTQHFILKLREHISFSRIGIFIERKTKQPFVSSTASNRLECVASLGIPNDLIDCFQLSRDVGIGASISTHSRIISAQSVEAESSPTLRKEFAILGCQLAVPITDRERLIGVAVLNGPVTERNFSEDELQLLYLLMEELGLAIRNSRLHLELASHGQLIENVLSSILSGAIVIDENLKVLYTNDAARRFLGLKAPKGHAIEFAELPARLASSVHLAVEKGELSAPYFIPGKKDGEIFRVSIFPFTSRDELVLLPRPTMVLLEDFTNIEASKQTALESSRNELISLIAERFAHEIRNSLVPLFTHAQLIEQRIENPKFQKSLKDSLLKETGRIKRLSEQMLYLAQHSSAGDTDLEITSVFVSAFNKAKKQLGLTNAKLIMPEGAYDGIIHGNPEALCYAFEELFLNGLQSSPEIPKIHITLHQSKEGILRVRIKDEGKGFTEDNIEHAAEAFFTTRSTGVGLGLSVARKVINEHRGFLKLNVRSDAEDWDIEIQLPEYIATTTTHT